MSAENKRLIKDDVCPACGASWKGDPIPEDSRQHYGNATHWSRGIGIELRNVYDGVVVWKCPDCKSLFHRFTGEPVTDLGKVTREGVESCD